MNKTHHIVLFSFIFIFLLILEGCGSIYSFGLSSIKYEGKEYIQDYNSEWVIEESEYKDEIIEQDGNKLSVRIFENDKNHEFIYCNDNSCLYHDNKMQYPNNSADTIDYFTYFISADYPDENIKIDNGKAINELAEVLRQKPKNSIKEKGFFVTLRISYKDYPAVNYYGNLIVDESNKYWVSHTKHINTEDDLELINEYYPIPDDSLLIDLIP